MDCRNPETAESWADAPGPGIGFVSHPRETARSAVHAVFGLPVPPGLSPRRHSAAILPNEPNPRRDWKRQAARNWLRFPTACSSANAP